MSEHEEMPFEPFYFERPRPEHDPVGDSVWDSVRASLSDSVWDSVRASLSDSVWDSNSLINIKYMLAVGSIRSERPMRAVLPGIMDDILFDIIVALVLGIALGVAFSL